MGTWLQRAKDRTLDPYDALTSIAGRLSISRRTAESHRANVMRKLDLSNQTDLIRFAIVRDILALPPDPLRQQEGGHRRPAPN